MIANMLNILAAACCAAQIVIGYQLPRHEGHEDNPSSTSVSVHYVYVTDYTTVYPQPLTATLSSSIVPSSTTPVEYVYITEYTTVYAEPSTSDHSSSLTPKRTETIFVTVTVPLNETTPPGSNSPVAWSSTSHYVYESSNATVSTRKPQCGFRWPTPRNSSGVRSTSSALASTLETRNSNSTIMKPSGSNALASSSISTPSVLIPASSDIEYGNSTPYSSTPALMPMPEQSSSTAVVVQPIDPSQQFSTAVVVVPITNIPPNMARVIPRQTNLDGNINASLAPTVEDATFTIQTIDVPFTIPTTVLYGNTAESKTKPTSTSSSKLPAIPSNSLIATTVSAGPHCPYPYPNTHCSDIRTTVVAGTKTKNERPLTTKGKEANESAGACPYPGQRC